LFMEEAMGFSLGSWARILAGISLAAWLIMEVVPVASGKALRHCNPAPDCATPCPPPPVTEPRETEPRETEPRRPPEETRPTTPETPPDIGDFRPPAGPGETVAVNMQGNQLGIAALAFTTTQGGNVASAVLVPSVRGFRISEDESPKPQDRVYFGFNFFDRVGEAVNQRLLAPVSDLRVYRETFGVEKTFLDGDASLGLRLPLNTLTANSEFSSLNGSNTDIGDLTVILKYAFWRDCHSGSLLSAGLALTVPTGPDGFAGSHLTTFHNTIYQPYLGYLWNAGNFFVHGFLALDVPSDSNDVTYLFNDIGAGYHLRCGDGFLTDIIPTFEVHLSDPLNHRGALNLADPAGSSDQVDFTTGVTFEFKRNCTLALGVVTPVSGPRPFDYELLAQLNIHFGGHGRGPAAGPQVLGN